MAEQGPVVESKLTLSGIYPLLAATLASLVIYYQQALLLLLKVGEVFSGVFDTSVPAFPLAGMAFVLMFLAFRWREFLGFLASRGSNAKLTTLGIALIVAPYPPLLVSGSALSGSYVYAAFALSSSWVGVLVAIRPAMFHFLWPYLLSYILSIGSVSVLTLGFGDPLAAVVAALSKAMTWVLGLPVQWTSVYFTFNAAGGSPMALYISQECSGIASMSIFLLLTALMFLDMRPGTSTTIMVALGGSALFVFLNSLRVLTLIIGGIYGGSSLLWSLHGWVGYVYYVVGYAGIMMLVVRKGGGKGHPSREGRLVAEKNS